MHCLMRNVLFLVFVLIGNFVVLFWVQKLFDWKEMYIPNNFFFFFGIKRVVQNGWLICMLTAENLFKHSNFDLFL